MYKKFTFIFPFLSLLLIGIFVKTYAQEKSSGVNITVSPTSFDLTNDPESVIQNKFRIRNNLDNPIPFTISVGKLLPNGSYNDIVPSDIDPKDEFIHWIHFDQASISVRPKEWTDIKFTITIPKTAAFGYYYAIRIKQSELTNQQKISGSKLLGEVLIPILLEVKKDGAHAEGKIISFTPTSYINEYLPIEFTTVIGNVGNVHINPRGNIFIHTGGEKDMAVLDVNASHGNILPGGRRNFSSKWNDGFFVQEPIVDENGSVKLDKNNHPMTKLAINWNKLTSFRLGKYTANLIVVYDNGKKDVALEGTTTFWVIPYKIIGGTIVSIIVAILLLRFLIQWYVKREMRKYKEKL